MGASLWYDKYPILCMQLWLQVWAGSQVTKLLRAGGALAMAPLVDRGLALLQQQLHLKTMQQAFVVVVAACLAVAGALFGFVVALHA